jgi:hypothetical protein
MSAARKWAARLSRYRHQETTMIVITGIEAEILRCNLRCTCGRQLDESDFLDIDNVVTLKCGSAHGAGDGGGCGATLLVIVFGSDFVREFWSEEHDYAESAAAQ